ncbi:MAG: hypothetical protein M1829_003281 [Trizodia sp. TS-e1964]|nr:MAG: hypothetical protein M1829_003281 [Trizodia sp. TS-e1964]
MNNVKSFWLGWGSLIVAGGGAYYFAKRSIIADRAERHEAEMRRQRLAEACENASRHGAGKGKEKSKYEASEPFRAKKGDRFS